MCHDPWLDRRRKQGQMVVRKQKHWFRFDAACCSAKVRANSLVLDHAICLPSKSRSPSLCFELGIVSSCALRYVRWKQDLKSTARSNTQFEAERWRRRFRRKTNSMVEYQEVCSIFYWATRCFKTKPVFLFSRNHLPLLPSAIEPWVMTHASWVTNELMEFLPCQCIDNSPMPDPFLK